MMGDDIKAATLRQPYISLAEKNSCRVICSAFNHFTEVASDRAEADCRTNWSTPTEWVKSWAC